MDSEIKQMRQQKITTVMLDAQTTFRHAMQAKIGQGLGTLYEVPQGLPVDMLKLLMRVINSAGK